MFNTKPRKSEFLLSRLREEMPELARRFLSSENPLPPIGSDPIKLHLGCGDVVLPGFVNIDFLPVNPNVIAWNLLDMWPEAMNEKVSDIFSEDVLEHFFQKEQMYILCAANNALQDGGIFRVLMPSLEYLVESSRTFNEERDWFMVKNFGVATGADMLNHGMRFGGHRWLHDEESFKRLATLCGYTANRTTCAESSSPSLNNLNQRDETNSLSFAFDLVKSRRLDRIVLQPAAVKHAEKIEDVGAQQSLYCSTNNDAQVIYELADGMDVDEIILLNHRGCNISQFDEHNFLKLYLRWDEQSALYLDSSMQSCRYANLFSNAEIQTRVRSEHTSRIRIDPSQVPGEYFIAGPLEIFTMAPA